MDSNGSSEAPAVRVPSGIWNSVLYSAAVEPATAKRIFDGCQQKSLVADWSLDVPKPEHLAAMKVRAIKNDLSRRLQDLADIRQLAALPGTDRRAIRGYFEELGLASLFAEIER